MPTNFRDYYSDPPFEEEIDVNDLSFACPQCGQRLVPSQQHTDRRGRPWHYLYNEDTDLGRSLGRCRIEAEPWYWRWLRRLAR